MESAAAVDDAKTGSGEVRAERPEDFEAVENIDECVFGGRNEARVVKAVRDCTLHRPDWSLVAEFEGVVSGHVLFSYVGLEDAAGEVRKVVVLAPLAVLPAGRRRGVGSALVREGLVRLESAGEPVVVVRGGIGYYGRFGFRPSVEIGIHAPFHAEPDHYLAKPLPAWTPDFRGVVRYPVAFQAVGYAAQWQPLSTPHGSQTCIN